MAAVDDLDRVLEQWHPASDEFLKGNPEPVKKMWTHREDVTLANPYGPPVRGWDEVAVTAERAMNKAKKKGSQPAATSRLNISSD